VNDDEHSLFMALRIGYLFSRMCGTKRLNPFLRQHQASEVLNRCRINNSSKCSNCYGLALLGARGSLCEICSLSYARVRRCPRQTLRKGALYSTHAIQKFHSL